MLRDTLKKQLGKIGMACISRASALLGSDHNYLYSTLPGVRKEHLQFVNQFTTQLQSLALKNWDDNQTK